MSVGKKHTGFLFLTIILICVSILISGYSNKADFTASLRSPVDIPIYLSGTFGEMRGNHFHAGIDIKTNGVEGLKVYAIQSGTVSRIKVSPWGYGKALYIDHPEGYTSVYGHLQKFNDKIERYIKSVQYAKESFAVDEYLSPGVLKIEKGEVIGWSGNSGGSYGPHLHFEIRESGTQIPLNPLAFGFNIKDEVAPDISDLVIYPLESKSYDAKPLKEKIIKKGDQYVLSYDTVTINSRQIGLGINTYDRMNGVGNHNGIHELSVKVDGETIYQFIMDRISFPESRYVQAHMDYRTNAEEHMKVHRCYQLPGNQLSIYDSIVNSGKVKLEEGKTHDVIVCIKDFNNNTSLLNFCMKLDMSASKFLYSSLDYDTIFDFRVDNTFKAKDLKVFIPSYTLYDSLYFHYKEIAPLPGQRIYSSIHDIHYEFEPAHRNFTVSIKPNYLPYYLKNKALIVRKTLANDLEPQNSYWSGEYLSTNTRDFGQYYILVDTIAPEILPVNISNQKVMTNARSIKVKIMDELSGIKSYRGTVNGKWILMEYDAKNDLLTYFFDEKVEQGQHDFVLVVTDEANNRSVFQSKFRR